MIQESQFADAIVPIYCDGVFMGTGFIYRSYLITAAHVIREYEKVNEVKSGTYVKTARIKRGYDKIIYCSNRMSHVLDYKDNIYAKKEYGDERVFGFIDEDLAIYKLPEQNNRFSICEEDDLDGLHVVLYGFHYYNDDDIRLLSRELVLSLSHTCMNVHHITQDKCFYGKLVHEGEVVIGGYSGGPVLCGNKIVGMLVGGPLDSNTFHLMKSKHIVQKIRECE